MASIVVMCSRNRIRRQRLKTVAKVALWAIALVGAVFICV